MQLQIEVAVIGLIQALMVAIIGGLFARTSKKQKEATDRAEVRAVLRAQESALAMKLTSATLNLSTANAIAIKRGEPNGETDAALTEAKKAMSEYYDLINGVAAKQITT